MFKLKKNEKDQLLKCDLAAIAQAFLEESNKSSDLLQNVVEQVLAQGQNLKAKFKFVIIFLIDREQPALLKQVAMAKKQDLSAGERNYQVKNLSIPINSPENLCAKVMSEKENLITQDLEDLLCPPFSKDKARRLQEVGGIKTALTMPIIIKDKSIGIVIYGTHRTIKKFTPEELYFTKAMNSLIGVAAENSRLFKQIEKDKEELERKNLQLKKSDLVKDEFIAVASHELRTPLTAIKNYIWLALNKEEKGMSPRAKECLETAYGATRRTIALINDMLVMSRIENNSYEINLEAIDAEDLMVEICQELKPFAFQKNIEIECKSRYKNLIVYADKIKLAEAFRSILDNAIKFTQQGKVSVRMDKKEYMIVIKVIDEGPGIKKDDLPRLFVKFSRLESSYAKIPESGTGLGLYIAKQIVERHGGKIEVESEESKGSTFTILLPEKTISRKNDNA